jgi:hypothetical protein
MLNKWMSILVIFDISESRKKYEVIKSYSNKLNMKIIIDDL